MPYYISSSDDKTRYQSNGQPSNLVNRPAEYSSESDAAAVVSSLGSDYKVVFAVSANAVASNP